MSDPSRPSTYAPGASLEKRRAFRHGFTDQSRWAQSAASRSGLARGHKAEAGRNRHELRQRSHTHLVHHPSTVLLNGDFSDTELTANLIVQQAANSSVTGIAYAEVPLDIEPPLRLRRPR